ncbi:peptidoglycan editing factor PgeF [Candidatus Roizmanbacteria bacterium]|nr:peptidoglycan editing factor PgeF [Candidatus Roizmanbacteria bacterium]
MIQSALLSSIALVKHAFTVKDQVSGDMKESVVIPRQSHSDRVVVVSKSDQTIASDGLITILPDTPVGIITADCVPILIADPEQGVVSAVHAGWKGTLEHIVLNAVRHMIELGSSPSSLIAAIGPAIKSCCYDIPEDRTQLFMEKFGANCIIHIDKTNYIDLQHINVRQLIEAGLSSDHIDCIDECTACNMQYYSYRRGDRDKRMISYIYLV